MSPVRDPWPRLLLPPHSENSEMAIPLALWLCSASHKGSLMHPNLHPTLNYPSKRCTSHPHTHTNTIIEKSHTHQLLLCRLQAIDSAASLGSITTTPPYSVVFHFIPDFWIFQLLYLLFLHLLNYIRQRAFKWTLLTKRLCWSVCMGILDFLDQNSYVYTSLCEILQLFWGSACKTSIHWVHVGSEGWTLKTQGLWFIGTYG